MSAALTLPAIIAGLGAGVGAGAGALKNNSTYEELTKTIEKYGFEVPYDLLVDYFKNVLNINENTNTSEKTKEDTTTGNKGFFDNPGRGGFFGDNNEFELKDKNGLTPMPSLNLGAAQESDVITAPLPGEFEEKDKEGLTPMASLGLTATPEFNQNNNNDDEEEEEKKDNNMGSGIMDTSDENVEEKISTYDNIDNYLKLFQEEQDKYIALQEKWRKEDQERADTAYSRAIKDMYKSGIDPNQIGNITPAEVGGTVQQPYNAITTGLQTALSKEMEVLQTMIEQSFKGDENEKDRFTDVMQTVINMVAIIGAASMRK